MPGDVVGNPHEARALEVRGPEVRALIEARCVQHQRAAILAARGRLVAEAVFLRVEGRTLTLELLGTTARQLRSQAAVVLTFSEGTTAHTFFARVEGYDRATRDELARLRVELPLLIGGLAIPAARVTRHSFRVPIVGGEALRIEIEDDEGGHFQARVVDISLGGVALELRRNIPAALVLGRGLTVHVHYGGITLDLRGEVRSVSGAEIGICFYTFGEGDELRPPPSYERLVSELERHWLRKQRDESPS